MRFVSCYAGLGLGTARKEKYVLAVDGQRDLAQESLPVQFTREYLTQEDIDFALSFFPAKKFTGIALEQDGFTPEPLALRIGVFDTEQEALSRGWSDEERELVEKWMLAKPNYGQDFVQIVPVEKEIVKPWPAYNNTHHFKVAALAEELGLLEETLAYEKANKNRQGVIDALEEKLENRAPKAQAEDAGEVVAA